MKTAPKRALRDSELLRDLHAGKVLDLASHEHFSELFRELTDTAFQTHEQFPAFRVVVRSIAARDLGSPVVARVAEGSTLSHAPAYLVTNDIDRNSKEPRSELRRAVEALGAPCYFEKGRLNQVVQIGIPGARESRDEPIDRSVVAIEERAQSRGISSAERGQKLVVRTIIGTNVGGEGHDDTYQSTTRTPIDAQGIKSLSPVDSTSR